MPSLTSSQRKLELNCPQIIGKTGEIWIKLIKRDVEKYANETPSNPASWHKVYRRLVKAHQRDLAASEEQLMATMSGLRNAKKEKAIQWVSKEEVKEPKVYGMQYAPAEPKPKKPAPPVRTVETLRFGGGSRTKTTTGHGLMQKIKREAREASLRRPGGVLATPNHLISAKSNASKVTKAPPSMAPPRQAPAPQRSLAPSANGSRPTAAPSRPPTQAIAHPAQSLLSVEERERRRLDIAKRRNAAPETRLSPPPPIAPNTSAVIASAGSLSNGIGARAPTNRQSSPDSRSLQPSTKRKRPAPDPFMPAAKRRGQS